MNDRKVYYVFDKATGDYVMTCWGYNKSVAFSNFVVAMRDNHKAHVRKNAYRIVKRNAYYESIVRSQSGVEF